MSTDAAKVRMLQANLEHMVGQLEAANKETAAAVADASKQRELVGQITKKLDSVSKKNKALEKDAQRILSSREHMVSTEVQSEPDAVLLAAHAEVATLTEAVAELAQLSKYTKKLPRLRQRIRGPHSLVMARVGHAHCVQGVPGRRCRRVQRQLVDSSGVWKTHRAGERSTPQVAQGASECGL